METKLARIAEIAKEKPRGIYVPVSSPERGNALKCHREEEAKHLELME